MDHLGTILVLEPDHILRDLIVLSLKRNGYSVITAEDWLDALAFYKEYQPQLILLEILLPQMNGLDLIKELKSHGLMDKTKIIVISALGYRDIVSKAIEVGASDFLVKPLDIQVLLERVQKVLSPSGLRY
jgi:two-component system chemotaxis response regulator CheY